MSDIQEQIERLQTVRNEMIAENIKGWPNALADVIRALAVLERVQTIPAQKESE